jgi:hypothetical protein
LPISYLGIWCCSASLRYWATCSSETFLKILRFEVNDNDDNDDNDDNYDNDDNDVNDDVNENVKSQEQSVPLNGITENGINS